jgi:hypothetical protein
MEDLARLTAEVRDAEAAFMAAVERRNAALRALHTSDPKAHSTRRLAAASGVSYQRVAQLVRSPEAAA